MNLCFNQQLVMKELIILSDLWGTHQADWMARYTQDLAAHFIIKSYDSRKLGAVPIDLLDERQLHDRFVNGGIDTAVAQLLRLRKQCDAILGFSIGGTIAWKACLAGLAPQALFAISSTRLRHETEKPTTRIGLFYGQNDAFQPTEQWFAKMQLPRQVYPAESHELYHKAEIAQDLCKQLIASID